MRAKSDAEAFDEKGILMKRDYSLGYFYVEEERLSFEAMRWNQVLQRRKWLTWGRLSVSRTETGLIAMIKRQVRIKTIILYH